MKIFIERYGIRQLDRDVALPDRGLVLVSGPNAAGKTSLLCDAPLQALFGTVSARGNPLLVAGSRVHATLPDGTLVGRIRPSAAERILPRIVSDGIEVDCDTATKATEWAEQRYGAAELWEGLLTYSWGNASDFTLGKDADRKRFVEVLIPGLDRFDAATERSNKRRRTHELAMQAAQARAFHAGQEVERVGAALQRAQELATQSGDEPIGALRLKLGATDRSLQALQQRHAALAAEMASPPYLLAAQQAHRDAYQAQQRAAADHASAQRGACPKCGSKTAAEFTSHCEQELNQAAHALALAAQSAADAQAAHDCVVGLAKAEAARVQERMAALDRERVVLVARISKAEAQDQSGVSVAALEEQAAQAAAASWAAARDLETAAAEHRALELAERAVGPKGARLDLIASTFGELERAAQRTLSLCWPGARLRIERTSLTKDGRPREESRVLVSLPGDSEFYAAGCLNRGMLRRVDLALRLGRRAILAARSPGGRLPIPYLAIDEALDGIDEEGLTGCAAALLEEARTSLVVVISHDEKVIRGVPYSHRVQL